MGIVEDLQRERILCRKKDPARSRVLEGLLKHVKETAKEEHRDVKDTDIVTSAKRVVKALSGVLDQLMPNDKLFFSYTEEIAILKTFIPEPPSEAEVREAISILIDNLTEEEKGPKSMGLIMKALKIRYSDLDSKLASGWVRETLS